MATSKTAPALDAAPRINFWESATPALREAITSTASVTDVEQIRKNPDAPAALEIMDQLASGFQEQENHNAAEQILLHTVTIRQNSPHAGPEHPGTLGTMFKLALEQDALGKYAQAEENWYRLLGLYERVDGRSNLAVMYNLARVLNIEEKFADAEGVLRQLLPKLIEALGRSSQQAIGALRELSVAIGGQGRYEEAKEMIVDGIKILDDSSMSHESQISHRKGLEKVGADLAIWKLGGEKEI